MSLPIFTSAWIFTVSFLSGGQSAFTNHTCANLGCGNHDSVCWCESSCLGYNDCCADFEATCPQTPPNLVIKDLNLVVTTDIHAWIEGREHEPLLNATLGDAVSTVERLKALAHTSQRDVFFFDNGDINDGTGLSATAADHVDYLSSLMQAAPYDALNLGNHELYQRNAHGAISGEACPITGLRDSGYIARWKGRYLTSNTVWADSREPVGSRFAVVEGEHGTKLLVFGFLYNMPDHCDAVLVEDVATTVNATWFRDALLEHGPSADAVVVLAHMDYKDDLVFTITQAIRANTGAQKAVQLLTGHSHRRGWTRVDDFASSYEAGCKLNTLGFISFDRATSASQLAFSFADIDGNTAQFAGAANTSEAALETPGGLAVNKAIASTKRQLGLDAPLGCADQRYRTSAALTEPDSLWTYYMSRVLPSVLFKPDGPRARWAVVGTGALTYDIYKGTFTKDDAYTVSPYGNFWFTQRGFLGADLVTLLAQLNGAGSMSSSNSSLQPSGRMGATSRPGATWGVPAYVASSALENSTLYDVIYCDFDSANVEALLEKIAGRKPKPLVFHSGSNTSSVLEEWFKEQPCKTDVMSV